MVKNSRNQSVISRQSDEAGTEDHWLRQFENSLQKGAVQPRSESLFDQINSVMNGKSKYPSVQAAVDDMMQRSGLTAYLENVKTSEHESHSKLPKTAAAEPVKVNNTKTPRVITEKPSILSTLKNIISKGNMSVPAIISRLHSLHSNDISDESAWEDDDLVRLVSKLNLQAKANNPANFEDYNQLGQVDNSNSDSDIDASNTDAFNALMPAKL